MQEKAFSQLEVVASFVFKRSIGAEDPFIKEEDGRTP
jgi:hypothetical protein